MKAYSIVSIVITCIFFIIIAATAESLDTLEASAFWGFLTGIYAMIFSIIGLVWSVKKSPKNITIMVMSIIGIIISFLTIIMFFVAIGDEGNWSYKESLEGAAGWGMISSIFLLPHSIVALVQSNRSNKNATINNVSSELEKLDELRRKGIISDQEFEEKKRQIL